MINARVTHSMDCDGYRYSHYAEVAHHSVDGIRLFRAACTDCAWTGSQVGYAALAFAKREAQEHTREVPCAGECVERSIATFGNACTASDRDECRMMRERSVAGTSDTIPACPVHGAW